MELKKTLFTSDHVLLCFLQGNQQKHWHFGETLPWAPFLVCVIVHAQIALRRIFNISFKFILLGMSLIIKLLKQLCVYCLELLSPTFKFVEEKLNFTKSKDRKKLF